MPVYDMVKWATNKSGMTNDTTIGSFMQRIGASLISGLALATILYPFDTFKRNSQLNGGIGYRQAFADPYECSQFVFRENKGNAGLYRGCATFAASQVILAFIQFSLYDTIYSGLGSNKQVALAAQTD